MEMAPISYAENDGVSIRLSPTIERGAGGIAVLVPGFVGHLEIVGWELSPGRPTP